MALAFGLTVLTGVYAFGTISGGHFNPAVTLGAAIAKRVEWKALPAYWVTQVIGGVVGGPGDLRDRQGQGGLDGRRQHGRQRIRRPLPRRVLDGRGAHRGDRADGVFLLVILGSTDDRAPKGFAGLAIGLTLTLIHLISIPISNTSVNPARSTAVAFFNGDGAPGTAVAVLAGATGRRGDRRRCLPVPVRPQRGTRRPAGPRRRTGRGRR